MFLDSRLPEDRAFFRINACRKPVDEHIERVCIQIAGIERSREAVIIGNKKTGFINPRPILSHKVLLLDPVFKSAGKMTEMQLSGRTHPA